MMQVPDEMHRLGVWAHQLTFWLQRMTYCERIAWTVAGDRLTDVALACDYEWAWSDHWQREYAAELRRGGY
jgi:hypothetical protein